MNPKLLDFISEFAKVQDEHSNRLKQIFAQYATKPVVQNKKQPKKQKKTKERHKKSGYQLYQKHITDTLKTNSDQKFGLGEIARYTSLEWKKLTDEERQSWKEKADAIASAPQDNPDEKKADDKKRKPEEHKEEPAPTKKAKT